MTPRSPGLPQLVVFDYDGTLADSRAGIAATMQAALAACQLTSPRFEAWAEWLGLPLVRMIPFLLGDDVPDAVAQRVMAEYHLAYPRMCSQHTRLFDGMRQVLDTARAAEIWLAIATSKGRAGLDHTLGVLHIGHLFVTTRTVDQVRHPKPHPEMLESILDELGVDPRDAFMIGDTTYDMDMGRSANVRTIGVAYGTHGADRLKAVRPDYIVNHPLELLPLLGLPAPT